MPRVAFLIECLIGAVVDDMHAIMAGQLLKCGLYSVGRVANIIDRDIGELSNAVVVAAEKAKVVFDSDTSGHGLPLHVQRPALVFRVALPSGGAILFVVGERTSNIDAFAGRSRGHCRNGRTRGRSSIDFDVGNANGNIIGKAMLKAIVIRELQRVAYRLLRGQLDLVGRWGGRRRQAARSTFNFHFGNSSVRSSSVPWPISLQASRETSFSHFVREPSPSHT